MLTKNLLALALLFTAASAFAETVPGLDAAKQKFAKSDQSEATRSAYVGTLADLLNKEVAEHMRHGGHDAQVLAIDAELKKYPAPRNSDSKALTKLRVGHWQSPRHTYIFRENGTWRFAPEDGTTSGTWQIKGNQYLESDRPYTILVANQKYFVYTDGQAVFFEYRL
ncbi:hypothetical protein BH09VER1_BH09VER1_40800 [soil metagenome]